MHNAGFLGNLGEFGFIDWAEKILGRDEPNFNSRLIKGIGDDAAVIDVGFNSCLLLTTDILKEGVHFDLSYEGPRSLGFKALAVNASDIAAMGGDTWGILLSLALPGSTSLSWLKDFFAGIKDFQNFSYCYILGGDTSKSQEGIFISVTSIGFIPKDSVILFRSSAKPGDAVLVTGKPGSSAIGLELLRRFGLDAKTKKEFQPFIESYLTPKPPISFAKEIATIGLGNAAIDLSDGLFQDLGHIAKSSQVCIDIFENKLPINTITKSIRILGFNALKTALSGGEDYCLILTAPKDNIPSILKLSLKHGVLISEIGIVKAGKAEVNLVDSKGQTLDQGFFGFDHFSR